MADGVLYCLNLNSLIHSRVRSRSPLTFNTKLYVTTVNNTFQPLTFFYHEEFHLRCCIGLEYCNMIQKNSKRHRGQPPPHNRGQSWKIMKNSPSLMPWRYNSRGFIYFLYTSLYILISMHSNIANILIVRTDKADPPVLALIYGISPLVEGHFFPFYIYSFYFIFSFISFVVKQKDLFSCIIMLFRFI